MASILTGDTFSRPSAQRKIGFSAYKRYALGLALALLWIVFYSWPTVSGHLAAISDPVMSEDLPSGILDLSNLPPEQRLDILQDRWLTASAATTAHTQRSTQRALAYTRGKPRRPPMRSVSRTCRPSSWRHIRLTSARLNALKIKRAFGAGLTAMSAPRPIKRLPTSRPKAWPESGS